MEIKCTKEQKDNFILFSELKGFCPFDYKDEKGNECKANANCRWCLNNRIKWDLTNSAK